MDKEEKTIDILDIFNVLKKHIVFILIVTILAGILGGIFTKLFIPPKYEASSTMIVNTRQDQKATVTNDQILSAKNLVSTYSIIVLSDTVLNEVIDNLDLDLTYQELKEKTTVAPVDNTQVMKIVVKDENSYKAKEIVNEITEVAPDILKETVEAGSVKIISKAKENQKPVSPNVGKNIAIITLLGLIVSIAIVLIRDYFDNTFKSDADITKYLELPILGVIPKVGDK